MKVCSLKCSYALRVPSTRRLTNLSDWTQISLRSSKAPCLCSPDAWLADWVLFKLVFCVFSLKSLLFWTHFHAGLNKIPSSERHQRKHSLSRSSTVNSGWWWWFTCRWFSSSVLILGLLKCCSEQLHPDLIRLNCRNPSYFNLILI